MVGPTLEDLQSFAVDAAWHAGRRTLAYFHSHLQPECKADGTPVTCADREAETLIRQLIGERFPDDGIIGEEFGEQPGQSGRVWILDPIDGTKSFVHGVPLYGVLIGLTIDGEPQVGVIHLPALGDTFTARKGGGCFWNSRRVQVADTARLEDALICSSDMPIGRGEDVADLFRACRLRRTWGDAYGYALVASGRADIMIDSRLSIWDLAALIPIITEAGGRISDLQGHPGLDAKSAIAANPRLHAEALAFLASHSQID
jgi:histidinol-phosphatase